MPPVAMAVPVDQLDQLVPRQKARHQGRTQRNEPAMILVREFAIAQKTCSGVFRRHDWLSDSLCQLSSFSFVPLTGNFI